MKKIIVSCLMLLCLSLLLYNIVNAEQVPYHSPDQQNTNVTSSMGNGSSQNRDRLFAQSFIPTVDHLSAVSCFLNTNITVEIRTDNGGIPSETILGSSSTSISGPSINNGFVFDPPVSLTPGVKYYIVAYRHPDGTGDIGYYCTPNDTYSNGNPYYKESGGNWVQGIPYPGYENGDYVFKTHFTAYDERPIAEAGDPLIADANEAVMLDGSNSYDPDGTIVDYIWRRLPKLPYLGEQLVYSGPQPTYETKALGRVEEVIELTVTDDHGVTNTDTTTILNRKIKDTIDTIDQLDQQVNPPLQIISPPDGSIVTGIVNVDAYSKTRSDMFKCDFYVDNKLFGSDGSSPFRRTWNSSYFGNGWHTIKADGYFGTPTTFTIETVTIKVYSQNSPVLIPTISITSPLNGATVNGNVNVTTDATTENFNKVSFYVDSVLQYQDTSAPFEYNLDTTTLTNGSHSIKASGWHKQALRGVSNTINVNVSN